MTMTSWMTLRRCVCSAIHVFNYHIGFEDQFVLSLYVTPGSRHPPRVRLSRPRNTVSFSFYFSILFSSFVFLRFLSGSSSPVLLFPFHSQVRICSFSFSSRAFLLFPLLSPALTFFLVSPISSTYCRPPVSIMHLKWRRLKDQRLGLSLASLSIYPFSSGILQYKLDS